MSKTYAVKKAAAHCKYHTGAVRQYIRDDAIMASRPSHRYCITQATLDVFLARRENEQIQALLKRGSKEKC